MSADRRLVIAAGIAGAAALAHRVSAGPLNPPAGPITSTPGPEPRIPISASTTPGDANAYFRITQPGSYFLTGNIRLLANKGAIAIDAEDVTLDLNGFGIIGNGQSGFPLTLILNDGGCTVRNGLIHAWGAYVTLNQARNCVFEDLTIRGPYSGNLEANAQNSIFRRLIVESSGEVGIAASQNCLVEDCVVVGMGTGLAVGIGASLNSIVRNCTVRDVGVGITAFGNCIVENCSVFNATSVSSFDDAAINCDNGSIARNCQVSGGAKAGIRAAGWSHAEGNRVQNSAIGVAITTFTSGPMRCPRHRQPRHRLPDRHQGDGHGELHRPQHGLQCVNGALRHPRRQRSGRGRRPRRRRRHHRRDRPVGELPDLAQADARPPKRAPRQRKDRGACSARRGRFVKHALEPTALVGPR